MHSDTKQIIPSSNLMS